MDGKARMLTVNGTRSYTEPRLEDYTWTVDLAATMDHYSARPVTGEFDYALTYLATFKRKRLDAGHVKRLVDFAKLWRVNPPAGSPTVEAALNAALGQESEIDFQLVFRKKDDALFNTLSGIPTSDADGWALALAAAMPWSTESVVRQDAQKRVAAYAPLFKLLLTSDQQIGSETWKSTIERHVPIHDRDVDFKPGPASFLFFVTGGYRQLRERLEAFVIGLRTLARHIRSTEDDEKDLQRNWPRLEGFWSQRPYITASGVYLLDRAETAGALAGVERTMTVTTAKKAKVVATA